MDRPYRVCMTLKVEKNGKPFTVFVYSEVVDSAEKAKAYADTLLGLGVIIAYRVQYKINDTWYMHDYVKYVPVEIQEAKVPAFRIENPVLS